MEAVQRLSLVIVLAAVAFTSGCSTIQRLKGNMDQMVYHMGVMSSHMPIMANSTSRMAAMSERMEKRTESLLANFDEKQQTAERSVQNYAQAFVDNDRAIIKSLRAIQGELNQIKQSFQPVARPRPLPGSSERQEQINKKLLSRLEDLEKRLAALDAKITRTKKN